jgi:two-component system, OmpR family, alkaline phosphatase synthesis response regulator PhoP
MHVGDRLRRAAGNVRDANALPKCTVLIVDDEPELLDLLSGYLRDEGFSVLCAADGPAAVEQFERHLPDLVILDLDLSGGSGIEVLHRIRSVRDLPVILLSARGDTVDRVTGLELGVDDYVVKPFSPREVVARVKSVLRRAQSGERRKSSKIRQVGAISIDTVTHEVRVNGRLATVTPTQFRILDVLSAYVGQTLTRDELLHCVSGESDVLDRTLDRHIANLRARVEPDPVNPRHILTVFGVGYKMVDPS